VHTEAEFDAPDWHGPGRWENHLPTRAVAAVRCDLQGLRGNVPLEYDVCASLAAAVNIQERSPEKM
jgi:hypothetical protein